MKSASGPLRSSLDKFSGVYLWIGFIVLFGVWTPSTFLTMSTVHSVASTQAIGAILAIAVLIPLVCDQYDLSVGANANFCGILAVVVQINYHWPVALAVVLGIVFGVFVGFVNGFVVVRLGLSSFIATLAMGSILAAAQIIITKSQQPAPVASPAFVELAQRNIGGFQIVVIYLIILVAVAWWFLDHTPAGRYLRAAGGNREAARISGIQVDRWSWISLVIAGGVSGLAGVLFTSQSGPSLTFGPSLLLPAFAAVFLGSTQLQPGRFNAWGTLIAVYVLATGVEGLQLVSGQQWLSDMFNGVALILAVALAVTRTRGGPARFGRLRRSLTSGEPPTVDLPRPMPETQPEPNGGAAPTPVRQ